MKKHLSAVLLLGLWLGAAVAFSTTLADEPQNDASRSQSDTISEGGTLVPVESNPYYPCCLPDSTCELWPVDICEDMNGIPYPEYEDCEPDLCTPPTAACCIDADCVVLPEAECLEQNGEWYPDLESCDPDPCGGTPTTDVSWGTIKSIYF